MENGFSYTCGSFEDFSCRIHFYFDGRSRERNLRPRSIGNSVGENRNFSYTHHCDECPDKNQDAKGSCLHSQSLRFDAFTIFYDSRICECVTETSVLRLANEVESHDVMTAISERSVVDGSALLERFSGGCCLEGGNIGLRISFFYAIGLFFGACDRSAKCIVSLGNGSFEENIVPTVCLELRFCDGIASGQVFRLDGCEVLFLGTECVDGSETLLLEVLFE